MNLSCSPGGASRAPGNVSVYLKDGGPLHLYHFIAPRIIEISKLPDGSGSFKPRWAERSGVITISESKHTNI